MAETPRTPPFLWLHIKKSGGQSIRRAIGSAYVETARKNARPYIAFPEAEELVEWLYARDIENLGYDFTDEAPAIRDLNTASGPL